MHKNDIERKNEEICGEFFGGQEIDNFEFENCTIRSCDFSAANILDLRVYSSTFIDSKFSGASCTESFIRSGTFNGCKCDGMNFRLAKFKNVVFESCNLQGADFQNASLKGVIFRNCDLRGTSFVGADLTDADVSTSVVQGISINIENFKGLVVNSVQALYFSSYLEITIKD